MTARIQCSRSNTLPSSRGKERKKNHFGKTRERSSRLWEIAPGVARRRDERALGPAAGRSVRGRASTTFRPRGSPPNDVRGRQGNWLAS